MSRVWLGILMKVMTGTMVVFVLRVCLVRYYATGTTQDALIGRMLMNGNVEMNTAEREPGFDITCGSVYGYDRNGELGDVNTGFFHGTASE